MNIRKFVRHKRIEGRDRIRITIFMVFAAIFIASLFLGLICGVIYQSFKWAIPIFPAFAIMFIVGNCTLSYLEGED